MVKKMQIQTDFMAYKSRYILIMRGTPLMLQIIAVYYAIPMLMAGARKSGADNWFYTLLGKINTRDENYMFIALVVAFVLNYAAYFAEIFRGGIESIPIGQYEASSMLGMTQNADFFQDHTSAGSKKSYPRYVKRSHRAR